MLEWEVKTITSHNRRYKVRVAQAEPGHAYETYIREQKCKAQDIGEYSCGNPKAKGDGVCIYWFPSRGGCRAPKVTKWLGECGYVDKGDVWEMS